MDREFLGRLQSAEVIDLAHDYFPGMPHWPTHPPFLFGLTRLHGEQVLDGGASSAADAIAMGAHTGTHIDALAHFSQNGLLCGGVPVEGHQSYQSGLACHAAQTIAPILRRGVLLDLASEASGGALPPEYLVTPEDLEETCRRQSVGVEPGDVVLLRTGWGAYFGQPGRFLGGLRSPGPGLAGARWLSSKKVYAAGSDTVAFERLPSPRMEVHVHLLVECGIHIIEVLNLEDLAARRIYEFVFAALPLKIRGATGAPVRPVALVP